MLRVFNFCIMMLSFVILISLASCSSAKEATSSPMSSVVSVRDSLTMKDTVKPEINEQPVQFLELTPAVSGLSNGSVEDTTAIASVKANYSLALKAWYVDQNASLAKSYYQKAIDALVAWGDVLAKQETTDDNANNLFDPNIDLSEAAPADDTKTENEENGTNGKMDYPNWLASGIIDQYKNLLEIQNEYKEDSFQQTVISRLVFYDIGLSGSNSIGTIKAPIAKGHAMDFIPINIDNERIRKFTDYLTKNGGANIKYLYRKFGRDADLIRTIIREEGVPDDMIYLAMIESGYSAQARSHAHAVGHWQFVKKTATGYGMNVDWWVDDRRDLYVSTRYAFKYLKDLFNEFGDWYLALAAYNAGSGRIYNAMKKNNTRDYWEMTKLPRETRNYVPYFIAATQIVRDPAKYGIALETESAARMDTVTVTECLDLEIIAQCVNSTPDSIRDLNPALLRWCTPPTVPNYLLKIPFGTRTAFLENYAKIPQDKKRSWVRYQVKYGETLSGIANRYGTDVKAIQQANQLKSSVNLTTGQWILIPVAPKSYVATKEPTPVRNTPVANTSNQTKTTNAGGTGKTNTNWMAGKKKLTFKVEAGQTLGHIAEWYNITAQNIRDWNGLYYGDPIFPGQVLTLYIDQYMPDEGYRNATNKRTKEVTAEEPGMKIYVVQDNDNLISIAKMFNVEVSNIKRWNKLSSNTIKVGDKLKIYLNDKQ
ncbi:LysM peptidoglycan-binding domain-containing protein [bacterium]|nr:LysM peptidoglycan-binding domain-containing protein [bacterium]